jgi:type IV pilus assembly protein PilB
MQSSIKSKTLMDLPLGQALVREGIITQAQLDLALEIQKDRKNDYLGEILRNIGVSQSKINEALDYLNKRKKIGEVLIDLGLITPENLKCALKEQKIIHAHLGVKRPLGLLLLNKGLIKYEDYMKALSKHFVLQIIFVENRRIHPSLQDVLGKRYVCEHQVLVLDNDGIIIKIALGAPTFSLMEEIRRSIPHHLEVIFYLAHPLKIESAQKKMFAPYSLYNYR